MSSSSADSVADPTDTAVVDHGHTEAGVAGVAGVPVQGPVQGGPVQGPVQGGVEDRLRMARRAVADRRRLQPEGTRRAYGAQLKMWNTVHLFEPPVFNAGAETVDIAGEQRFLVTEEKAFQMCWNQAYRKKRTNRERVENYSREEWQEVIDKHPYVLGENGQPEDPESLPESEWQYNGVQSFDQMTSALQMLAAEQGTILNNQEHYNLVKNSVRIKNLRTVVVRRAALNRLVSFEEKLNPTVQRLALSQRLEEFEEQFWNCRTQTPVAGMLAARNRCYFLCTVQALIRGECMEKVELSDLFSVILPQRGAPHPYHIMIMQILVGKTNQEGVTLHARFTRHKNVRMCALGGVGMYLVLRFMVTKEDEHFNFATNKNWFRVKFMVKASARGSPNGTGSNTIAVQNKQFDQALKTVLLALDTWAPHTIHLGRYLGSGPLEIEEVNPLLTRQLGNWDRDTHDKSYSNDLPMQALRVAAGFELHKSSHVNPRTQVIPDDRLRTQLFPFVDGQLAQVGAAALSPTDKHTAKRFLEFLDKLRDVVLQDVACLMLEGREHVLLAHPVFQSEEFGRFKDQMESHLSADNAAATRPMDEKIDEILPTVGTRFANVHSEVLRVNNAVSGVSDQVGQVSDRVGQVETTLQYQQALLQHQQAQHQAEMRNLVASIGQCISMGVHQGQQQSFQNFTTLGNIGTRLMQFGQGNMPLFGPPTGGPAFTMPPPPPPPRVAPPPPPPIVRQRQAMPPTGIHQGQRGPPPRAAIPEPKDTYKSFREAYNEWYGRNVDSPRGGFAELDKSGNSWRSHWERKVKKRFTRLKKVVSFIDGMIEIKKRSVRDSHTNVIEGDPIEASLEQLDGLWERQNPGRPANLSALEKWVNRCNQAQRAIEDPMEE